MAKIRLSFENFHASQWHFSRLFPYNLKILPTLHNSPSCVQLICIKRHLLLSVSHSPLPLSHLFFFDVGDVFHFLLPYLYMGRYRCKEWKNRDKMHFHEKQILILQTKESKIEWFRMNIPRKHFTLFALRCGFCPQRKFPKFSCFEMRPPRQGMLLAYVRTRIQQRFYFFAVTSVTEGEKWEFNSSPYKVLFFQKQRVVFYKTTYRFQ